MSTDKLYLELMAKSGQFKSEMRNAKSDMGKFQKSAGALKGVIGGLFAGFSVAVLVGGLKQANQAFETQRVAIESLNSALALNKLNVGELSSEYQRWASEIQGVTNFGDELIIQNTALLQSYTGNLELTKELIKATVDFAAANKMDLMAAFSLVGKTISSSTNALARYGIEIDTGADKTEKLALITEALQGKFEGAASAAVTTGVQLSNTWGDFLEVIGEKITPAIDNVNLALIFLLKTGQDVVGDWRKLGNISEVIKENWMETAEEYAKVLQGREKNKGNAVLSGVGTGSGSESKSEKEKLNAIKAQTKEFELQMKERLAITNYNALATLQIELGTAKKILVQYKEGTDEYRNQRVKVLEVEKKIQDEMQNIREDAESKQKDFADNIADAHIQIQNEILDVSQTFADAISRNLDGLLDGTKDFGDLMKEISREILKTFLNTAITGKGGFGQMLGLSAGSSGSGQSSGDIIIGSILRSFGGFFANGGNPPVGRPSIVGERGIEMFIPRTSGTIVPNGGFGGETNQTFVYAPQVRTSVNKTELMSALRESSREFYGFVSEGVQANSGLRNSVRGA